MAAESRKILIRIKSVYGLRQEVILQGSIPFCDVTSFERLVEENRAVMSSVSLHWHYISVTDLNKLDWDKVVDPFKIHIKRKLEEVMGVCCVTSLARCHIYIYRKNSTVSRPAVINLRWKGIIHLASGTLGSKTKKVRDITWCVCWLYNTLPLVSYILI